MNVIEAKSAFLRTCEALCDEAREKGFIASFKCLATDRDLREVEIESESAAVLSAELTIEKDESQRAIVLECAVAVDGGEVSEDEMLREIGSFKANVKDYYEKIENAGVEGALDEVASETEEKKPEEKVYDNKMFYIVGTAIGVAALVLVFLSKLF